VGSITDANYVSEFVGARLMAKGLLRSPVSLRRYCQGNEDPDSKLVFLSGKRDGLVVTVSPFHFPDVVAEECRKVAGMRSLLGELGSPLLEPLDSGRINTSSFAVLPYRKPLSKRRGLRWLARMRLRRHLLEWLREIAERRSSVCAVSRYDAALQALRETVLADSPTAALLRTAERHLRSGHFAPRSSPMHGDLWIGNVLHGAGSATFTLIDWRGSATEGFPIFDLIRAAESFGLSRQALHGELRLHQTGLGCQLEDLPLYLLGALGHYAANIQEMSPSLFRAMADESVSRLSSALNPRAIL
jgi:Phosphotransferase enzyme family